MSGYPIKIEQYRYLGLPKEDQDRLNMIHHAEGLVLHDAMNSAAQGANKALNVESTNTFGLTEAEKSSIEADINAKKPISASPAYEKFLQTVLGKAKTSFPFSLDTPEYEIHDRNIRANHAGAVAIVTALSQLFGRTVRLPNKPEAISSMETHTHLAGHRVGNDGGSEGIGKVGFAWLDGGADGENARCAWRGQNGSSNLRWFNRRSGYSVIPCFG